MPRQALQRSSCNSCQHSHCAGWCMILSSNLLHQIFTSSQGEGQRYESELRPEHEEQDGRAEHCLHPILRQFRRQSARFDDGGQSLLQKASTHRSWRGSLEQLQLGEIYMHRCGMITFLLGDDGDHLPTDPRRSSPTLPTAGDAWSRT